MTFQSALRDKHLQGLFQVETITSDRGRRDIIVSQVVRLWTDFTGANGSISFFRRTTDQGEDEPNLEFLLTDFPFPFEMREGGKKSIRMKFAQAATKPLKQKSTSNRRPSWFKFRLFSSSSSTNSMNSNKISSQFHLSFHCFRC
jgi:hypothetical protein